MQPEALPAVPVEKMPTNQCPNHETFQLQPSYGRLIQKRNREKEETDATRAGANYSFHYYEIVFTAIAIATRFVAICINIKLAIDFYKKDCFDYFLWTITCLGVSLVVTSVIHFFMCYNDGMFQKNVLYTLKTCLWISIATVFRYYKSLVYAIRCKLAEQRGHREDQIKFYKLALKEESDVAFLKLFECFLEAAPQKILQISIVLSQKSEITDLQIFAICMYFVSMAWCLTVYQRYVRYSQEDKFNINLWGQICQLCWHFCTSVSRTLTIAFIASVFPLLTLYGCLLHIGTTGLIIFIADRPYCPKAGVFNFLFCLVFGIIYLFTFISTRDEPTFYKYIFYYTACLIENIACIALFAYFASDAFKTPVMFYSLCSGALAFYALGIFIMMIYYTRFHPQITARRSKRRMVNNN